jgi:hypothetical protein
MVVLMKGPGQEGSDSGLPGGYSQYALSKTGTTRMLDIGEV